MLGSHLIRAVANVFPFKRVSACVETAPCKIGTLVQERRFLIIRQCSQLLLEKYFDAKSRRENSLLETLYRWLKQNAFEVFKYKIPSGVKTIEIYTDIVNYRLKIIQFTGEPTMLL